MIRFITPLVLSICIFSLEPLDGLASELNPFQNSRSTAKQQTKKSKDHQAQSLNQWKPEHSIVFIKASNEHGFVELPALVAAHQDSNAFVKTTTKVSSSFLNRRLKSSDAANDENTKWEIVIHPGTLSAKTIPVKRVFDLTQLNEWCVVVADRKQLPPPVVFSDYSELTEADSTNVLGFETISTNQGVARRASVKSGKIHELRQNYPGGRTTSIEIVFDDFFDATSGYAFSKNGKFLGEFSKRPGTRSNSIMIQPNIAHLNSEKITSLIEPYHVNDSTVAQFPLDGNSGKIVFFSGVTPVFDEPRSLEIKFEFFDQVSSRSDLKFSGNAEIVKLQKVDRKQLDLLSEATSIGSTNRFPPPNRRTQNVDEKALQGKHLWMAEVTIPRERYLDSNVRQFIVFQTLVDGKPASDNSFKISQFIPVVKGPTPLQSIDFSPNVVRKRILGKRHQAAELGKLEPQKLTGPGTKIKPTEFQIKTRIADNEKKPFPVSYEKPTINENKVQHRYIKVDALNANCPLIFNHDQTKALLASEKGDLLLVDPTTLQPTGKTIKIEAGLSAANWIGNHIIAVTANQRRVLKIDSENLALLAEFELPSLINKIENGYEKSLTRIATIPGSKTGFVLVGAHLVSFDTKTFKPDQLIQLKPNRTRFRSLMLPDLVPVLCNSGKTLILKDGNRIKRIAVEGNDLILEDAIELNAASPKTISIHVPATEKDRFLCNFVDSTSGKQEAVVYSFDGGPFANHKSFRHFKNQFLANSFVCASTHHDSLMLAADSRVMKMYNKDEIVVWENEMKEIRGLKYLEQLKAFVAWNDTKVCVTKLLDDQEFGLAVRNTQKAETVSTPWSEPAVETKIGQFFNCKTTTPPILGNPAWSIDEQHVFCLNDKNTIAKIRVKDWTQVAKVELPANCHQIAMTSKGILALAYDVDRVYLLNLDLSVNRVFKIRKPGLAVTKENSSTFVVLTSFVVNIPKTRVPGMFLVDVDDGILFQTNDPNVSTLDEGELLKSANLQTFFAKNFDFRSGKLTSDGKTLIVKGTKMISVYNVDQNELSYRLHSSTNSGGEGPVLLLESKHAFLKKRVRRKAIDSEYATELFFDSYRNESDEGFSIMINDLGTDLAAFLEGTNEFVFGAGPQVNTVSIDGNITDSVLLYPFGFRKDTRVHLSPSKKYLFVQDEKRQGFFELNRK